MPLFNQVSIVGVGLIGGSLAKAIQKRRIAKKVVGIFRSEKKLRLAVKKGIVQAGSCNLAQGLADSELIILAQPVEHIVRLLPLIKQYASPQALIIDVGSTKAMIVRCADRFGLNFVGCHPLAGSEKKGFAFSQSSLFDSTIVILTPSKKTCKQSLKKIIFFWKKLSSKVVLMNPERHDKILAFTSHLPHIAAYSLIHTIPQPFLGFSATGLKDTTRIALSDAELWTGILLTNKKELLKATAHFERAIKQLIQFIRGNKKAQLRTFFAHAQAKRKQLH